MTTRRLSSIAGEAILPLAELKAHLRVEHDDEDDLIREDRAAAISAIERFAGIALGLSSFLWKGGRPVGALNLPIRPVAGVEAVRLVTAAATTDLTAWQLIGSQLLPATAWPDLWGEMQVEFTAGFDDLRAEAPDLLQALKQLTGYYYNEREAGNVATGLIPASLQGVVGSYAQVLI